MASMSMAGSGTAAAAAASLASTGHVETQVRYHPRQGMTPFEGSRLNFPKLKAGVDERFTLVFSIPRAVMVPDTKRVGDFDDASGGKMYRTIMSLATAIATGLQKGREDAEHHNFPPTVLCEVLWSEGEIPDDSKEDAYLPPEEHKNRACIVGERWIIQWTSSIKGTNEPKYGSRLNKLTQEVVFGHRPEPVKYAHRGAPPPVYPYQLIKTQAQFINLLGTYSGLPLTPHDQSVSAKRVDAIDNPADMLKIFSWENAVGRIKEARAEQKDFDNYHSRVAAAEAGLGAEGGEDGEPDPEEAKEIEILRRERALIRYNRFPDPRFVHKILVDNWTPANHTWFQLPYLKPPKMAANPEAVAIKQQFMSMTVMHRLRLLHEAARLEYKLCTPGEKASRRTNKDLVEQLVCQYSLHLHTDTAPDVPRDSAEYKTWAKADSALTELMQHLIFSTIDQNLGVLGIMRPRSRFVQVGEGGKKALTQLEKTLAERLAAALRAPPAGRTEHEIREEHEDQRFRARREHEKAQLSQFRVPFSPGGDKSPSCAAVFESLTNLVATRRHHNVCFRMGRKRYNNLSPLAESTALFMTFMEHVFRVYSNHVTLLHVVLCIFHVFREGVFHPHPILWGNAMTGKSFIHLLLQSFMIPKTFCRQTYSSPKAFFVPGDFDDLVQWFEEIRPTMIGLQSGNAGSNKGRGMNAIPEEEEARMNALLTGDKAECVIQWTNPETKMRELLTISSNRSNVWVFNCNFNSGEEVTGAAGTRFAHLHVADIKREHMTIFDYMRKGRFNADMNNATKLFSDSFRRDQAMVCLLYKMMLAGVICFPDMNCAEIYGMRVMEEATKLGLDVGHNRNFDRVKMLTETLVIKRAIVEHFDYQSALHEKAWDMQSLDSWMEHIISIQPRLCSRAEDVHIALKLCSAQYEKPVLTEILRELKKKATTYAHPTYRAYLAQKDGSIDQEDKGTEIKEKQIWILTLGFPSTFGAFSEPEVMLARWLAGRLPSIPIQAIIETLTAMQKRTRKIQPSDRTLVYSTTDQQHPELSLLRPFRDVSQATLNKRMEEDRKAAGKVDLDVVRQRQKEDSDQKWILQLHIIGALLDWKDISRWDQAIRTAFTHAHTPRQDFLDPTIYQEDPSIMHVARYPRNSVPLSVKSAAWIGQDARDFIKTAVPAAADGEDGAAIDVEAMSDKAPLHTFDEDPDEYYLKKHCEQLGYSSRHMAAWQEIHGPILPKDIIAQNAHKEGADYPHDALKGSRERSNAMRDFARVGDGKGKEEKHRAPDVAPRPLPPLPRSPARPVPPPRAKAAEVPDDQALLRSMQRLQMSQDPHAGFDMNDAAVEEAEAEAAANREAEIAESLEAARQPGGVAVR